MFQRNFERVSCIKLKKKNNCSFVISLNGKLAALKEKVKENQRLKNEVKNVKRKLTDLKVMEFTSPEESWFEYSNCIS